MKLRIQLRKSEGEIGKINELNPEWMMDEMKLIPFGNE